MEKIVSYAEFEQAILVFGENGLLKVSMYKTKIRALSFIQKLTLTLFLTG